MTEAAVPELDSDYQLTLEQSVLPSPNSFELDRTPQKDFIDRLRFDRVQIAELFMENSKLTPVNTVNAALDRSTLDETRRWYLTTGYRPEPDDFDDAEVAREGVRLAVSALPEPFGTFLSTMLADERTIELMYATDVFLLAGGRSYRTMPRSPWLWLDRMLNPEQADRLSKSVYGVTAETMGNAKALLAFVVVPVRYTMLQGPRGYRTALTELGALLERCAWHAETAGIGLTTTLDFHDYELDRLLLFDGTERSTHAIGMLSPSPPETPPETDDDR